MSNAPTLAEDPNLHIPEAVRAAAARSQAMFEAAARGEQVVTSEGNFGSGDDDYDTMVHAQSAPASETQITAEPQAAAESAPAQPQEPAQPSDPKVSELTREDLEHRYNSIMGRYRKQADQLREMTDQIRGLQNVIATLQTAPAPSKVSIPELDAADLTVTPEEMNDYGEDLLKVVGKKAKSEILPILQGALAKVAELEAKLNGVTAKSHVSDREKMHQELEAKVPNWMELNENADFISWLGLPDPYSGVIRHDMLKEAYQAGNATRVANFFKGFLAEEAAVAPVRTEPAPGTTEVQKVPLAELAAPGRAKTAASQPAPAEKPIITRAQVSSFYADVAAGRYRGNDAEKDKVEKAIFEAQREGRIR
jgi:hypothetical protein